MSNFRKYAVSTAGAMGYTQVMPFWVKEIGTTGQSLFHIRNNLRFGCVILRHYLDMERGDLFRALGRYNGSLGQPEYPNLVLAAWKNSWTYRFNERKAAAPKAAHQKHALLSSGGGGIAENGSRLFFPGEKRFDGLKWQRPNFFEYQTTFWIVQVAGRQAHDAVELIDHFVVAKDQWVRH